MTPCEKLGYKVGDRVEVFEHPCYRFPVGSEMIGYECTVMALFENLRGHEMAAVQNDMGLCYVFNVDVLRPLRTERDKAIDELEEFMRNNGFAFMGNLRASVEKLYDAGIRKQQHKEG